MNPAVIFVPVVALVLLTFLVWLRMYQTRLAAMRANRVQPEQLTTSSQGNTLLPQAAASSDNFSNLFELPVLFYAIAILLYLTQTVDPLQVILASGFVAGRYAHSIIATTYNKVMHRFYVYVFSSLLLWGMWLLFAIDVVHAVF